ncbi:MAG TPA: hypothetical protein V6D28_21580 [Leptolyngbyaceae cyanobacterium]
MDLGELYPETLKYQPFRDEDLRVVEEESDYVNRMHSTSLSNWPEELLKEWLYRHADHIEKYAFLEFEKFQFTQEVWLLNQIPGREAFDDEQFCDNFRNVRERAENPHDWLAQYMLREGTWNTPVILLNSPLGQYQFPSGKLLKHPYHLLEGHRRLSFLNGLIGLDKAAPEHKVWLVRIQT